MANKTLHNKKALIKAMKECYGIVTNACNIVGISRTAYYDYYKDDPEFKKEIDDVSNVAIDFVEGELFKRIEKGDITGIIFYLKSKAKDRGYVERTEQANTHQFIDSIEVKVINGAKDRSKPDLPEDG